MLFFNTWGILNAFGVYQTYYESGELFSTTSSNISWIGSIEAVMLLLVGFFAGPVYDRGYLRTLLLVGGFLIVFGHMMLSLCHKYWQVVLAQGFVIGKQDCNGDLTYSLSIFRDLWDMFLERSMQKPGKVSGLLKH